MSAQDPISTYHSTLEKLARQRFGARGAGAIAPFARKAAARRAAGFGAAG